MRCKGKSYSFVSICRYQVSMYSIVLLVSAIINCRCIQFFYLLLLNRELFVFKNLPVVVTMLALSMPFSCKFKHLIIIKFDNIFNFDKKLNLIEFYKLINSSTSSSSIFKNSVIFILLPRISI